MRAKDRRELERTQQDPHESDSDWEVRRVKEELKQEERRRRKIRREQEYDITI